VQDREWFARRKDKLMEKRRYFDGPYIKTFIEYYSTGSAYGIKELRQIYEVNSAGESSLARQVFAPL
jgi:hypothetical protein